MRVGFHTFGCKLNQYETEALASSFRRRGFSIISAEGDADLYVVNTCTVTTRADHKARAFIRALARNHPDSLLIVTGCSAQLEAVTLSSLAGNIVVVPQAEKAALLDLPRFLQKDNEGERGVRGLLSKRSANPSDPFAFHLDELSFHTRAYLKVQDGCDSFCAYCRVPLARGPSASLEVGEAARRARSLEDKGYREIVITGVNISSWRSKGSRFPHLVSELLGATRRARLRLSSIEPEAINEELAGVLADKRICPHFHIPVQSGSNTVLGLMHRRYRAEQVREGIALLRLAKPDPFLAADVIVGFPGETADDFAQTRRLIEEMRFAALHVFPFSPRPGTAAASMRPQVPERIRNQRAKELGALSGRLAGEYARSCVGKVEEVILEGKGETTAGTPHGVTGNYLKLIVRGIPAGTVVVGKVARARVAGVGEKCVADFIDFS